MLVGRALWKFKTIELNIRRRRGTPAEISRRLNFGPNSKSGHNMRERRLGRLRVYARVGRV